MLSNCCNSLMSARLLWTKGLLSPGRILQQQQLRGLGRQRLRFLFATSNDAVSIVKTDNRRNNTSMSMNMNTSNTLNGVSVSEIELSLADGMTLKGQRWIYQQQQLQPKDDESPDENKKTQPKTTTKTETKILALHGWLDNCRSFHYLAPRLIEKLQEHGEAELVAIDFPGHGWSSHRPLDGPTIVLSEGAYYIAEIIDALGWGDDVNNDKVALIGHSMGGGMAITFAGAFPEQVSKVVSIDMYGPEPGKPENAAANIRSHVTQRRSSMGPKGRPHSLYPSLERAIERRQKSAQMAPGGNQYLSLEAATELVTRSTFAVYKNEEYVDDNNEDDNENGNNIKGYRFRHDTRMLWPSLQYLTAEQIESIMKGVECPVCILAAEDGYPFAQERIDRAIENLKPEIYKILPGSHHLHADPDTADALVDAIYDFFRGSDDDDDNDDDEDEDEERKKIK